MAVAMSLACAAMLALSLPCAAQPKTASDLSGTWQGDATHVLELTRAKGGYHGEFHYLGEDGGPLNGNPASVTLSGQTFKFSLERRDAAFEGLLSADGKSIAGTWKSGPAVVPVTFTRASADFVIDRAPHKSSFVTVDKGVKLEVLDFGGGSGGGNGAPLVLLAGLGNTAHNFDKFALNFTARHHVYAITRRGHGVSSAPSPTIANYDADRLGDDVIAVLDALKLERPVLAGHSMAGEELSSIGSRHPDRVAGLIYMDAGYTYAYYTPGGGIPPGLNTYLDARELRQALEGLTNASAIRRMEVKPLVDALLQKSLPEFQKDLAITQMEMKSLPSPPPTRDTLSVKVSDAMLGGARKYIVIKPPVLAFYASQHAVPENAPAATKAYFQAYDALTAIHANAFEAGVPGSHVVRLGNADHYVYRSNEAEVTREMDAFMDRLGR
jgi:pimeloyl-ACP methyl ester carboxylesterase